MTSTNPFDDLVDVTPILHECNRSDMNTASNICTCTDPGESYETRCAMEHKEGDDHSGRSRCHYGSGPIPTEVWKRSSEQDKEGTSYHIGSASKKRQTFDPKNGGSQYPPSLKFCAPTGAHTTGTTSLVQIGGDGVQNWNEDNPRATGTTNLGFE